MFCGTESFFRTGYRAHLVSEWLPALDGVVEKLERGALVADVGCGHGASAVLMAKAFPRSDFTGVDYHAASIARARDAAARAGVSAATRTRENPASRSAAWSRAGPAWAPRAGPSGAWSSATGVQIMVEAA